MNTPLVDKLVELEKRLSAERGGFSLFALLMRVDSDDAQDLVVAAPWLNPQSHDDLEWLVGQVRGVLSDEEMRQLSGVVILSPTHIVVTSINFMLGTEHAPVIFTNNTFIDDAHPKGITIKGGVIITSERRR